MPQGNGVFSTRFPLPVLDFVPIGLKPKVWAVVRHVARGAGTFSRRLELNIWVLSVRFPWPVATLTAHIRQLRCGASRDESCLEIQPYDMAANAVRITPVPINFQCSEGPGVRRGLPHFQSGCMALSTCFGPGIPRSGDSGQLLEKPLRFHPLEIGRLGSVHDLRVFELWTEFPYLHGAQRSTFHIDAQDVLAVEARTDDPRTSHLRGRPIGLPGT